MALVKLITPNERPVIEADDVEFVTLANNDSYGRVLDSFAPDLRDGQTVLVVNIANVQAVKVTK